MKRKSCERRSVIEFLFLDKPLKREVAMKERERERSTAIENLPFVYTLSLLSFGFLSIIPRFVYPLEENKRRIYG
jgi:hypothetical protein